MATDATGSRPPTTNDQQPTKRKKSFYAEEEDIIVKPSTELIPDEYEHSASDSVLFHAFSTPSERDLAESLLKCVQDIDYKVDNTGNRHDLNKIGEFKADLEAIREEAANKSALILFFIGYSGKADGTLLMLEETEFPQTVHVKEVWNIFAANNCPELKHKPKIFVFCIASQPSPVQTDSMRHRIMTFDKVYDFPAEADMLIVFKKVNDPWFLEVFINELRRNIAIYSKKYDIIDLVSYIHKDQKSFPLLVSTLTRKFYLTPNDEREHYLSVVENHTHLEETLQKLQDDIQKLRVAQKKKKEKKFSFSFKKKSEEKPKVVKRKETPIVESPRIDVKTDGGGAPRTASVGGPNRMSGGSVPVTRSRQPSVSETNVAARKPIWKI